MFDKWTGWDIGQKVYYLWGADRDTNIKRRFKEAFIQKYVFRNIKMNAFDLSFEKMEKFARILEKAKPRLIISYANVAVEYAKYIKEKTSYKIQANAIITSAETLTNEKRTFIEEVFECKVYNRYGSREVGLIAAECSYQEGLHINSENVYVEINTFKAGSNHKDIGEIIVTDLNNYAMPFIRYNMGDVGIKTEEACSCGRGLPLIKDIKGRSSDFIKTKVGKIIHGESFSHLFYGISGISKYQIIQKDYENIIISICSPVKISAALSDMIIIKMKNIIGNDINVSIERVNEIKTTANGKYRFAISEINDHTKSFMS
jgi:phenylacetate-CoA ligase